MKRRKPRIALYSHDTMGLGHMRRNLLIAQSLANHGLDASVLLVCGAFEASAFPVSPRVDCLTLPAFSKETNGHYDTRRLNLPLRELVALRARTIAAAIQAYAPDLFIADNVPRGALRELDPTLESLHDLGTRCVLGLRDVLDDPQRVRCEWAAAENEQAIRDYYDAIWVYGDPRVYELAAECGFSREARSKLQYVGYLDQRAWLDLVSDPLHASDRPLPARPFALCAVGGGQDGAPLARTFAEAADALDLDAVILTGPFMPPETRRDLHRRATGARRLHVLEFVAHPGVLVERAACVVGMGGYNSVCEVLSFGKPGLIVPRVRPRREQLIRARRLQRLNLVDVLHPDDLSPRALADWLSQDGHVSCGPVSIDFAGLSRLPGLVEEMLWGREPLAPGTAPEPGSRPLAGEWRPHSVAH